MADLENVAEEIQQEDLVQPQEEQVAPESQSPEVETQEVAKEQSDKDRNFIRLRETKEQLEKENRELKKYFESQQQRKPEVQEPEEDDFPVDDDDLVDGKVVKRLYKEIKTLRKTYEQEKLATIPDRLRSKFADFDQVVTVENVEKLRNSEPELYESITSGKDLYAKGVSAYKALRMAGIVKEDPYVEQKAHVQKNQNRPVSTQAVKGQGALADANAFAKGPLSPELRKRMQQEMAEAVKAR